MTRRDERRLTFWFAVAALGFDALMAYTVISVITRSGVLLGVGATI